MIKCAELIGVLGRKQVQNKWKKGAVRQASIYIGAPSSRRGPRLPRSRGRRAGKICIRPAHSAARRIPCRGRRSRRDFVWSRDLSPATSGCPDRCRHANGRSAPALFHRPGRLIVLGARRPPARKVNASVATARSDEPNISTLRRPLPLMGE
jgi:hypothetical protein